MLSSLSPNADLRGRQFERITKWFLLNDPVQKAQFREVWLWDEWPEADGPDIGIDLVAERRDRSLVAIQVKCYAAEYQVSASEPDPAASVETEAAPASGTSATGDTRCREGVREERPWSTDHGLWHWEDADEPVDR